MFCRNCGAQVADGAVSCHICGYGTGIYQQPQYQTQPRPKNAYSCPRCGSHSIQFQTVTESKKTGCFMILVYIILAVTIVGWLILIPLMLRKKTETVTYAVCQSCGMRRRV